MIGFIKTGGVPYSIVVGARVSTKTPSIYEPSRSTRSTREPQRRGGTDPAPFVPLRALRGEPGFAGVGCVRSGRSHATPPRTTPPPTTPPRTLGASLRLSGQKVRQRGSNPASFKPA